MNFLSLKIVRNLETLLFYLMLFAGIIPLFSHPYFVTLDGPAHLYSGIILRHLLTGDNPLFHDLFQINNFPVPNWTSHFLFALFSSFLPAYLTEKAVLFIYLFFTPVIFRKLVLHLAPENRIFSWLMILFVHNQIFYFGFFNFSFGILFLFLTVWYCYKYCDTVRIREIIFLAFLFLCTWFSHLLPFLVSLAVVLILSWTRTVRQNPEGGLLLPDIGKHTRNTLRIALAALPSLILTLLYMGRVDSVHEAPRPDLDQLFQWIADIRPLLALGTGAPWKIYTRLLFLLFLLMVVTHSFLWLKKSVMKRGDNLLVSGTWKIAPLLWFLFSMGFLLLYLLLPNAILLTERLILFFFLFLITWLAILKYPGWIHALAFAFIIFFHVVFTKMYHHNIGGLSGEIVLMKEAVKKAEPNTLLLTLNYHDNWLHAHTSGYAGTDHPVVVLENYEAGLAWFPVRWNTSRYQIGFLNDWGVENKKAACEKYINPVDPEIFAITSLEGDVRPVENVLLTCMPSQIEALVPACQREILAKSYTIKHQNDFCTLYTLNR